jgi:hypothetical protein
VFTQERKIGQAYGRLLPGRHEDLLAGSALRLHVPAPKKNNRESRDEHESDPKTKGKKNAIDNLVQKLSEHTEKHQSEGHCNQNKKRISQIQNVNQRGKTNFSDPRCNNRNFQLTSTRFTTDPRRSPPYLPHLIEN